MKKKPINVLIVTFFFVLSTITTALHELAPHHHSVNCPVCLVDNHVLSGDVINDIADNIAIPIYDDYIFSASQRKEVFLTTFHSRAPPSSSL